MKKLLLLLLIMNLATCNQTSVWAENPYVDEYGVNTKYSHRGDLMNMDLSSLPETEFSDSIIWNTCFYQEGTKRIEIFPSGIHDIEFRDCNLDNVKIDGKCKDCTLTGTTTDKKIKAIYDEEDEKYYDWSVEEDDTPIEMIKDIKVKETEICEPDFY